MSEHVLELSGSDAALRDRIDAALRVGRPGAARAR